MPTSRSLKIGAATLAATALVAVPVAATATPTAATPSRGLITHLLAQQGLGMGLANEQLQTSFLTIETAFTGSGSVGTCTPFGNVGFKVISEDMTGPHTVVVKDAIYYDQACTQRFITQNNTVTGRVNTTTGRELFTADGVSTYTAPDKSLLGHFSGTVRLDGVDDPSATVKLTSSGAFRPAGSARSVQSAIGCLLSETSGTAGPTTWACTVGIAQKVADLNTWLASTTPATYRVQPGTGQIFGSATLHGTGAHLYTATKPLAVHVAKSTAVSVTGAATAQGDDAIHGSYQQFGLLSPPQTDFVITDKKAKQKFGVEVTGDNYAWAGDIESTGLGSKYAVIKLDESGTGTIRYANRKQASPVTNWTLAD